MRHFAHEHARYPHKHGRECVFHRLAPGAVIARENAPKRAFRVTTVSQQQTGGAGGRMQWSAGRGRTHSRARNFLAKGFSGSQCAFEDPVRRQPIRMRAQIERGLPMNRPFGVPALAGPDRLKAGLQTNGVAPTDPI